jgi:hypothetical protein
MWINWSVLFSLDKTLASPTRPMLTTRVNSLSSSSYVCLFKREVTDTSRRSRLCFILPMFYRVHTICKIIIMSVVQTINLFLLRGNLFISWSSHVCIYYKFRITLCNKVLLTQVCVWDCLLILYRSFTHFEKVKFFIEYYIYYKL